ncbi:MAG TPA: response regulator transcription factor [Pyrinomonadaceae bacterium]|nr:response regulator transcription factor [Pyrinomonadaceae bacterium]
MNKLDIIIADDHQVVREGLKALINAQPDMHVVGEAGDGRAAWLLAKQLQPDVVLMDVSMPGMNGAEATERLRQDCPLIKVLALTVYEDKGYLRQLLAAGAAGYVLKRAVVEELVRAVRAVAAGGSYIDPTLAGKVVSSYISQSTGGLKQPGGELSERESQVLRLAAWGYSNKEIAAKLGISVKTVETYKVRLMEKLDLRSRADIVRYALRQGWLQDE